MLSPPPAAPAFVLLGGSGFLGSAIAGALLEAGAAVTVVDRRPPAPRLAAAGARWLGADLLTDEPPALPPGTVVVTLGSSDPRPRWRWTLAVDNAVATARMLPALAGRRVVLVSSIEVYGAAPPPLCEDTEPLLPWTAAELDGWCEDARRLAGDPCPPWRAAPLGRRLAAADPTGRWAYALSKLAQERLVAGTVAGDRLTVLRLANAFGVGQERILTRLARRALAGLPLPVATPTVRSFVPTSDLGRIVAGGIGPGTFNVGGEPVPLLAAAEEIRRLCGSSAPLRPFAAPPDDSCGVVDCGRLAAAGYVVGPLAPHLGHLVAQVRRDESPLFDPPLQVVVPPRPAVPDEVAERQQACLWSGAIKHGNRWSSELAERLAKELDLGEERRVLVTASGTAALRLVVAATVGPARPGDAAALPSFTFPATAEVLAQLGYELRFVDVDEHTWTLDPAALSRTLAAGPVRVVVCVDTFGNPCDYQALRRVCDAAGVPLLADSAASLGSSHRGQPVAAQADGHAYSMSFAKVLSAGGAGGAAVLPVARAEALLSSRESWARSELMNELHAVVALDQLAVLGELVRRRQEVVAVYERALAGLRGLSSQRVHPQDQHSYVHWVARAAGHPGREELARALLRLGVRTKPYFAALHRGPFRQRASLPVTEALDAEALALPMSSELTVEEAERVAIALRRAVAG